ncbi:MAG: family transposase [Betaproteobacteria bacterium]|nr:family transposase [Betaproteobacteria bacterium]
MAWRIPPRSASDRDASLYGRRIATVEPVFGNVRYNKRLDHFTLRTQTMVNIGRQMFAIGGVKLPSNADKRHSGTHAELLHDAQRIEAAGGEDARRPSRR